jgi:pyruvate/2-oxoglutarate dehydrogenase complex dihydrolipoamide dehydrogenase (E3) component
MPPVETFDFAVIGGGSAGYAAASLASGRGLKVVVVEGGKEVGGLCILRGCMPSKTLLAASAHAAAVRDAGRFGIKASYQGLDGAALQARKRLLVKDFADYRAGQLDSGRFAFKRGFARFSDPHTLEIRGADGTAETISARAFLIATGSRISTPAIPGLQETGYLDSDAFLDSERLPDSVTVLGGGAVALEAATYYAELGSKVTLLQRSKSLLKEADPDVSSAVTDGLRDLGVRVETNADLLSCESTTLGKAIRYSQLGKTCSVTSSEVLCALGRRPCTEGLGLETLGIAMQGARIAVSATQQTALPHIFAAGDVCGPHEVVHIGIHQGEVAARNASRLVSGGADGMESVDYRLKMFAVFSNPGVAVAGLSESEARIAGIPVRSASYPFSDHGKSMVEGVGHGFVKLITEAASGVILGAAVVGPSAAELIHEVVVAMHFRARAADLASIPHYHPTLSEIWTYPAEELS